MTVQKTYIPKADEIEPEWYVVNAADQNLGRFATKIAAILLGKHQPAFTPGVEMDNFVIVVNAERVQVTGKKLNDKKYYRHSMFPGGFRQINLRDQLATHPERVIRSAVWSMMPHNKFGRKVLKNLKVYAGPEHPHVAQQPKPVE